MSDITCTLSLDEGRDQKPPQSRCEISLRIGDGLFGVIVSIQ